MEQLLKLVLELGKKRGIPQFLYYAGVDPYGAIEVRKSVYEYKKNKPDSKSVDFILNSGGGSADDAYRIIRTLRNNFNAVNVIIPFWAKSAATLLSFGASSIIMDEFGEFGALDVQLPIQKDDNPYLEEAESALIDEISLETIENRAHQMFLKLFISLYTNKRIPINKNDIANDVFNYIAKFYEPILKQINPYKIGDKKRKLDIGAQYANRILLQYQQSSLSSEQRNAFIDYLVNDCPDHGYIVDYDLISRFLPNVVQSISLGDDYYNILTGVSLYLLEADQAKERFVGFVDETLFPSPPAPDPPIVAESLKKDIKKTEKANGEHKPA